MRGDFNHYPESALYMIGAVDEIPSLEQVNNQVNKATAPGQNETVEREQDAT